MYKKLANGVEIPSIGFGTAQNCKNLEKILPNAYKAGFRLFDTSDNYGNEEYVGKALSAYNIKDIFICTKFSEPVKLLHFRKHFRESAKKLLRTGNSNINLYLLHWPYPMLYRHIWGEMESLYIDGKCEAIGVCNFEKRHLMKLMKSCNIIPMINQFELHPLMQQKELCRFCKSKHIQIMAYSPLARMDKRLFQNKTLIRIAETHAKSVAQIILRWDYQHGFIPIPSSAKEEHIISNYNIWDFELSKKEMKEIDNMEQGIRIRFDPKKRFGFNEKCKYVFINLSFHLLSIKKRL